MGREQISSLILRSESFSESSGLCQALITVLTIFMFGSQLIQMPSPRDIVIYWLGPRAFPVVQKPRGWAHIREFKISQRGRERERLETIQFNYIV